MALPINLPSIVATRLLPYSGNPDSWNLILWILATCSILAFAVFIERRMATRHEVLANVKFHELRMRRDANPPQGTNKIVRILKQMR